MSEKGPMSPGWWQLWQLFWKIRTTSLLKVGAGAVCADAVEAAIARTARLVGKRMCICFMDSDHRIVGRTRGTKSDEWPLRADEWRKPPHAKPQLFGLDNSVTS